MSIHSATLHLGKKQLFRDLSLQIGRRDRIGVIGPNGAGKTSLLRLIAGELEVDRGELSIKKDLSIGYLPQELNVGEEGTILEFLQRGVPGRDRLQARVAQTEAELRDVARLAVATGADRDCLTVQLSEQLAELHDRLAQFDQLYRDHVALRILAGLGFSGTAPYRPLDVFSGGWKMRAVLARHLFVQPDLLLLDEPTNHLDMPSVAWLSVFLSRYSHPLVLICHDREFLAEQTNRIVSFEPEAVQVFNGTFAQYGSYRVDQEVVLANQFAKAQREREKAEKFINRFRAQATKARAVQSRIKALAKVPTTAPLLTHQTARYAFPPTPRSSKQVAAIEDVAKSFDGSTVFSGLHLTVRRGEKVGIIGINGAGKTTLLKILAGEETIDHGAIRFGQHVVVGYYAQHHLEVLHPTQTAYEEVVGAAPQEDPTTIRTVLGTLSLSGDDVDKPIHVLSGGEKARVALAQLLVRPTNLLLMDEPTNHLDLQSSERLAEALTTYDGAVIFASHNRSFVRRLATQIWNVADGTVEVFPGSLDEYLTSAIRRHELPDDATLTGCSVSGTEHLREGPGRHGKASQPSKERRRKDAAERAQRKAVLGPVEAEIAAFEEAIIELEERQRVRSAQLANPVVQSGDPQFAELAREFQRDAAQLEALNAKWEVAISTREQLLREWEARTS